MLKKQHEFLFFLPIGAGNGTIEFNEFITLMAKKMQKIDIQEEIKQAFQIFDKEGKGVIRLVLRHWLVGWCDPVMTRLTARNVNNGTPSLTILGKRIKILKRT